MQELKKSIVDKIHERALLGFILFTVALTLLTQSSRNLPLPSSSLFRP
ncbi:unnamed protein product [Brassica oleracea var. botrytis]